ncbi:MAG TPA: CDP-alcohol phosphatidyltransferase family protein [Polyangiaceae bacterium]|jgi:CDP-L-myo-inositol myo-inositolphosphotransferase|nr:CDP-alcohol phosphatidyltransferase family protein [Polyangiaceae bacterium]
MTRSFALLLESTTADPRRVVAGLSLALRLALDAQQGGASAIVVASEASALGDALRDARLRIPVLAEPPKGAHLLRVPANFVIHRGLVKYLIERDSADPSAPRERDLTCDPLVQSYDAPYAFSPFGVIDARTAREAERKLFRALRKPQDGWTSRYLNRYISLSISRFLVKTPLLPNQVSIGILGVGILGAVLAAQGGYGNLLIGAFLFQAQSVLDGCDGEMSRVTYRGSLAGEWLDTVGDDLTNYGFFTGAALGLYRMTENPLYLAAGAVTVVSGLIGSGLEYRYLIRIGSGDLLKYPLSQGQGTGKFAFIQPLFKRDTFVFLTLCAAALGFLGPMLCIFAAGAVGVLIGVIKTELRLAREARHARAAR